MAYTYKLKNKTKTVYVGVSKHPKKRAVQHKDAGKKFTSIKVTSKSLTRKKAETKETRDLKTFRKRNGRNPKYNKTLNGKYNL